MLWKDILPVSTVLCSQYIDHATKPKEVIKYMVVT